MLLSLAWRNLVRNRRRSAFTGIAVAGAVTLLGWLVGFTYGAYDKMIDSAVRTRTGHLQVMPEGALDQPDPRKVVPDAAALARRVAAVEGVQAVSPRALAEGLLVHGAELAAVDLVGVDPAAESAASTVPHRVLTGERAVRWCREQLAAAREAPAGWCEATGKGEFLPEGTPDAVVLGTGVAKRLLVTVGDELTVQVATPKGLAERRLRVSGLVAAGSPEIGERAAYLRAETLEGLLGTDGPNELAVVLRSIGDLERARAELRAIAGSGLAVTTWAERNPTLASLIEMMKGSRVIFFALLALLAVLSVANATLTSVLERSKQFGVMLALGTRPARLVALVMAEVALLGLLAVGTGAVAAGGLELYGRTHGWPMAWVGLEPATLEELALSGVAEDTTFFARMPPAGAAFIAGGVYALFLLTGLWAALKVGRLKVLDALRAR